MRPIRRRRLAAALPSPPSLALAATACGPSEDNAGDKPSRVPRASPPTTRSRSRTISRTGSRSTGSTWTSGRTASGRTGTGTSGSARPRTSSTRSSRTCGTRTGCGTPSKPPEKPRRATTTSRATRASPTRRPRRSRPGREAPRTTPTPPEAGKVFFDGPEGSMVCSAHRREGPGPPRQVQPGVDRGPLRARGQEAAAGTATSSSCRRTTTAASPPPSWRRRPRRRSPPYGVWWGDWAQTSDQWIAQGAATGGQGAPYDFAVLHVTPEKGSDGQVPRGDGRFGASGRLQRPGRAEDRRHRPPRLPGGAAVRRPEDVPVLGQAGPAVASTPSEPTMYRIGCTMTGGSSGGGWVAKGQDGKPRWCPTPPSARSRPAGWPVRASARRPRASSTRSARSTRVAVGTASSARRRPRSRPPARPDSVRVSLVQLRAGGEPRLNGSVQHRQSACTRHARPRRPPCRMTMFMAYDPSIRQGESFPCDPYVRRWLPPRSPRRSR